MKRAIQLCIALLFYAPVQVCAEEALELIYSTKSIYGVQGVGIGFLDDKFYTGFGVRKGAKEDSFLDVFSASGTRLWGMDSSYWQQFGRAHQVPNRNMFIFTERARCFDPSERVIDGCSGEMVGAAVDAESGKVIYQNIEFSRFSPVFSSSGKYMLGYSGYGGPADEMGEVSLATSTCLIEIASGNKIWCKGVIFSDNNDIISEGGSLIAGEKGVYSLQTGDLAALFPQYSKKGWKVLKAQKPGNAMVLRAISPDGKRWVITEGKCDEDLVKRHGVAKGCNINNLYYDMETYLSEWDGLQLKRKIKTFEDASRDKENFEFLSSDLLLDNSNMELIDREGATVLRIPNPMFPVNNYQELKSPDYNMKVGRITFKSGKSDGWKIFNFKGELVNHFIWRDPAGRDSGATRFKMIGPREFFVVVEVPTKKNENGNIVLEKNTEVYRGRFE